MRRDRRRDHIFLDLKPEARPYSRPKQKIEKKPFTRPNPDVHGPKLDRQLRSLKAYYAKLGEQRKAAKLTSVRETYVSVDYNPQGVENVHSLTHKKKSIEIALVRQDPADPDKATAVLRLGEGELKPLEDKVRSYCDSSKESEKGERRGEPLLGGITTFRRSDLADFWTSDAPVPADESREIFWEIWLSDRVNLDWLKRQALRAGLTILDEHILQFPDRMVVLGRGTPKAVRLVLLTLGQIMELRKPSLVKDFGGLGAVEQQ